MRCHIVSCKYKSLLRLPDTKARYADVPVMLGRHTWIAEDSANAATNAQVPLQFENKMTEEEKMAAVIAHAGSDFQFSAEDQRKHIEDANSGKLRGPKRPKTRIPPDSYVCVRCNIPGHWVQFCPTRNDERYDPKKILSTNGVSKKNLTRINLDEIDPDYDGNIYRDQHGRHYMRNKDSKDKSAEIASALFDLTVRLKE